jgi:hypothetical protein
MSGFVVDSRTLLTVRDTLGRLNAQLLGMHTVIWHQRGTLGGAALESDLEHFCGTWHYGVTELGGQLQDLTRRLGEAAAAYERIEERITTAGGGSGSGATSGGAAVSPTGSGHAISGKHHPHATAPGGKHYSGGAALAPAPTGSGGSRGSGDKPSGHSGHRHAGGADHSGSGSGTTVIGGGSDHNGGSHRGGGGEHHPGSGSGVTVIGGGPTQTTSSSGGAGTTTIDEKIHHAEDRQRAELAAVLKMVKD